MDRARAVHSRLVRSSVSSVRSARDIGTTRKPWLGASTARWCSARRVPLTVRDVVTMGRWARKGLWRPLQEEDRRIVDESILRVGLSDCERRPLHSLSGGQRQRAFVGHGIAQQADIFLLDEPTTGLDVESQDRIAGILVAEKERGATVVYASHDEAALSAADSVLQLRAGRLASEGDGCA